VVKVVFGHTAGGGEGQRVASPLIGKAEIAAGLPPLDPVRTDPPAGEPRVSDEMSQLVEKGAGQFLGKR